MMSDYAKALTELADARRRLANAEAALRQIADLLTLRDVKGNRSEQAIDVIRLYFDGDEARPS